MMRPMFGLLLAIVSSAALAVPAAYVHELQGEARASMKGQSRALQVGSTLEPGDEISVGKGSATLKFEDGQIVALQQDARFSIISYQYNKAKVAESNVALSLIKGGMRFITGVIGGTRRDAIRLQAATATIGIRGTDIILLVDTAGQILATVQDGVVSFSNQGVTAALNAGQGTTAAANQPPAPARPASQLPPAAIGAVAGLGQKTMPANKPVNVQASAEAVKAVANATDKAAKAAAAEKAAADAKTPAEKAKAAADLATAKAAATSAAAEAAQKITAEVAASQQAKQIAVQGGAPSAAGTAPPTQGQGIGLPPAPAPNDPATIIGALPPPPLGVLPPPPGALPPPPGALLPPPPDGTLPPPPPPDGTLPPPPPPEGFLPPPPPPPPPYVAPPPPCQVSVC